MKEDIEKRLHRVKIQLNGGDIKCPYSRECDKSVDAKRCNQYYQKCAIYNKKEKN